MGLHILLYLKKNITVIVPSSVIIDLEIKILPRTRSRFYQKNYNKRKSIGKPFLTSRI